MIRLDQDLKSTCNLILWARVFIFFLLRVQNGRNRVHITVCVCVFAMQLFWNYVLWKLFELVIFLTCIQGVASSYFFRVYLLTESMFDLNILLENKIFSVLKCHLAIFHVLEDIRTSIKIEFINSVHWKHRSYLEK